MQSRVHVSLEVSNLDAAISFYNKLFQTEPSKRQTDYANYRLQNPQLHLALVLKPGRAPEPEGSNRHFGVELFEDEKLTSWHKAVEGSGLQTLREEKVTCCYAVGDKFWARDPDGHAWEFWIKREDASAMRDANANASPKNTKPACCAPGTCC